MPYKYAVTRLSDFSKETWRMLGQGAQGKQGVRQAQTSTVLDVLHANKVLRLDKELVGW
jgi:hypothetical protein